MKRLAGIAPVALVLAIGCAHTKTTDDGTEKDGQKTEAKADKPRAVEGGSHKAGGDAARHSGEIPVATAPAGLLAPGAEVKIRDRLAAQGYVPDDAKRSDAAMKEGIRRFQRAHDLPATGIPDHETVKDLGLDPDQIFRQGSVKD
jgi:peptidoglycan hydrolase-like protein with peptidoglycan-binding domain